MSPAAPRRALGVASPHRVAPLASAIASTSTSSTTPAAAIDIGAGKMAAAAAAARASPSRGTRSPHHLPPMESVPLPPGLTFCVFCRSIVYFVYISVSLLLSLPVCLSVCMSVCLFILHCVSRHLLQLHFLCLESEHTQFCSDSQYASSTHLYHPYFVQKIFTAPRRRASASEASPLSSVIQDKEKPRPFAPTAAGLPPRPTPPLPLAPPLLPSAASKTSPCVF